jgi:hypothetical protein
MGVNPWLSLRSGPLSHPTHAIRVGNAVLTRHNLRDVSTATEPARAAAADKEEVRR